MTTNTILRQKLIDTISETTGIKDITPNSKIISLVDAFINELGNIKENNNSIIENMYIQTANDTFLDKIGASEGLTRAVNNYFNVDKATGIVQLTNVENVPVKGYVKKGTRITLNEDVFAVTKEDVDCSLITSTPTYISVDLIVTGSTLSVMKGSSYIFNQSIYITFNEGLTIPLVSESTDDYRNRILFSRASSKFGSEGAIKLCMMSTRYITDYKIDYNTNPPTIYVFHTGMLNTPNFEEQVEVLGINTIKTELNKRKADTTSYDISMPSKITIRLYISPKVTNPKDIITDIYDLVGYITNTYQLGSSYTLSTETIKTFLLSKNVDISFMEDYDFTFYKVFNNYEYMSNNNILELSNYEYPYLESIVLR